MNYATSFEVTRERADILESNPNAARVVTFIEDSVRLLREIGHGGFDSMLSAIAYHADQWSRCEPGMTVYRCGSHVAVHARGARVLLIGERKVQA